MNDRVFLRNFPWIPYMIFLFPQFPLMWFFSLHIYVVLLASAFGCICSQSQEVWKEHRAPGCGVSTLSCHITLPVYAWLLHCHLGFHRTVASNFYHMELKLINYFMALQSLDLSNISMDLPQGWQKQEGLFLFLKHKHKILGGKLPVWL